MHHRSMPSPPKLATPRERSPELNCSPFCQQGIFNVPENTHSYAPVIIGADVTSAEVTAGVGYIRILKHTVADGLTGLGRHPSTTIHFIRKRRFGSDGWFFASDIIGCLSIDATLLYAIRIVKRDRQLRLLLDYVVKSIA
jgi:hypothetical protein